MKISGGIRHISTLRQSTPEQDRRSIREQLLSQQHSRAAVLIEYLKQHADGFIILPLPVNILNTRRQLHWAVRNELKNQYHSHCDLLLSARLIPLPPKEPPQMWRVVVHFYGAGVTDEDNARAMAGKFPHDWLKGKWMIDDAPEYFKVVEFHNMVDRKVPRIEFRTVTTDAL